MRLFFMIRRMNEPGAVAFCCAVVWPMIRCAIFSGRYRAFPRKTRARAGKRDNAGQDCAEEREKDNCLVHYEFFPWRAILNPVPVLKIML